MNTELVVSANFCSSCGHQLSPEDRFCAQCGRAIGALQEAANTPAPVTQPENHDSLGISLSPEIKSIVCNRWIVIGLLAATGPIGLPALWLSPRFRPWVKVVISLLYFFATAILPLAVAWYWFGYALQPLVDIFGK